MSIHAGFSHNGSGPSAFGGADKWPTVRLEIPFCEGQEDRRDDFVDKLKAFIERELS
jgi:hypothetical protein